MVRRSAEQMLGAYGLLAISVVGVLGGSVLDACRTGERLSRYRRIRLSTFGRVTRAGFAVLPTFDAPHFSIVLPDVSEFTVARLERCFDAAIPNPAGPPPK